MAARVIHVLWSTDSPKRLSQSNSSSCLLTGVLLCFAEYSPTEAFAYGCYLDPDLKCEVPTVCTQVFT